MPESDFYERLNALLSEGDLKAVLALCVETSDAAPGDESFALTAFTAAMVAGDLHEAERRVNMLSPPSAKEHFSGLLGAFAARTVFLQEGGGRGPGFLAPPPDWVRPFVDAVQAWGAGERAGLVERVTAALEAAPKAPFVIHDEPVDDLRDADDFMAPVLELLLPMGPQGWVWVPWVDIARVEVSPPRAWVHNFWMPVTVHFKAGGGARGYIPTIRMLASGGADHDRLGRMTSFRHLKDSGLKRSVGMVDLQAGGGDGGMTMIGIRNMGEVRAVTPE